MLHGTEAYFVERSRAARRVALLAVTTASSLLGGLLLTTLPAFHEPMEEFRRFGVEGERRYVRRILLAEQEGRALSAPARDVLGGVSARKGGSPARPKERGNTAAPAPARVEGPGEAAEDLAAHAVSTYRDLPVVESDQLIAEHLVTPRYPPEALERNSIGAVTLLALVDTTGRVAEVDVLTSPDSLLTGSALNAVWQFRYRPYHLASSLRGVYALMRFNFTIDERRE